jgi:hypothetical protein
MLSDTVTIPPKWQENTLTSTQREFGIELAVVLAKCFVG